MAQQVKRLAILGSTGSIGTQTMDIVRAFPDRLKVVALAAGRNLNLLTQQVREFRPDYVFCADSSELDELKALPCASLEEMAILPNVDIVMVATVGAAGLRPTMAALDAGKVVALADKEVFIMAGEQVMAAAKRSGKPILPVDSEPSAIWQCLAGEDKAISKLIITASGGAFRDRTWNSLADVTPAEALRHPTWRMGPKITIDSATLMNKAFEVIEAHWLFDTPYRQIEAVIHRQSVIHSMVEFRDGSVKAHLGPPDMRFPIQYALFYPERIPNPALPTFDPVKIGALTFDRLDSTLYPCFELALDVGKRGGTWPAALAGADEAAVNLFISGRIPFTAIPKAIETGLQSHRSAANPSLDDLIEAAQSAARHVHAISGIT